VSSALTEDLAPPTCQGKEGGEIERHDEESDVRETSAGLEVAKGMAQALLLPTVLYVHLQTHRARPERERERKRK